MTIFASNNKFTIGAPYSTDNQIDKPLHVPYSFTCIAEFWLLLVISHAPMPLNLQVLSSAICITGTLQFTWAVVCWASLLKIFQVNRSPSFSLFITLNTFFSMRVIAILMDTLYLQCRLCFARTLVCQQTVFIQRFGKLNRTTPDIVTYFVCSGI